MARTTGYDARYSGDGYYWGLKPSAMCDRIIQMMPPAGDRPLRLIDLGCGEGRNAVYLARHGFEVTGLDLSPNGLDKTRRLAEQSGVSVRTVLGDVVEYELDEVYDVVFSTGTLQYLPPEIRAGRFENYKAHTSERGINALNVFVEKPFIPTAPDAEPTAHTYRSGELLGYYWDWEIPFAVEEIFDCDSSGVPHKHAVTRMIAHRYHEG